MRPEALRMAVARGALRLADVHFACRLERLAGGRDPLLLLAAALVSSRAGQGDVCLDLAACGELPFFRDGTLAGLVPLPRAEIWAAALQASPVVGAPGVRAPLVLDAAGRLYLARYWQFEHDLAAGLRARIGGWAQDVDRKLLRAGLERLFASSSAAADGTDWQRVAAAVAVLRPFCLISGGPGTGKTRTVAAILALLVEQAGERPLRIGLAAPTGKAAGRLTDAIGAETQAGRLPLQVAARLPAAVTLHRLLGFRPGRVHPRHGPDHPLHLDVLVVDEASMADLPLMARLVAALPPQARLILLGDRDQLASVEPGRVLGDIGGRGAECGYSPALCLALEEVGAAHLGPAARTPSACADHLVVLRRSWRFGPDSGIGVLARAVNSGDAAGCLAALDDPSLDEVHLLSPDAATLATLIHQLFIPAFRDVVAAPEPAAALRLLERVRLLAAVREGAWGVHALNARIEQALRQAGLIDHTGDLYAGRPLLITENDHRQELYNGELGLLLPDPGSGALRAWFAAGDGMRRVLPTRLPPHETVYAMTVHKTQGSEFDVVVLALPPPAGPGVTRELVYTAVTRARRRVSLLSTASALTAAVERTLARTTGLHAALWGGAVRAETRGEKRDA